MSCGTRNNHLPLLLETLLVCVRTWKSCRYWRRTLETLSYFCLRRSLPKLVRSCSPLGTFSGSISFMNMRFPSWACIMACFLRDSSPTHPGRSSSVVILLSVNTEHVVLPWVFAMPVHRWWLRGAGRGKRLEAWVDSGNGQAWNADQRTKEMQLKTFTAFFISGSLCYTRSVAQGKVT